MKKCLMTELVARFRFAVVLLRYVCVYIRMNRIKLGKGGKEERVRVCEVW